MKKSFAIVAALLTALSTQLAEAVGKPTGLVDLTSPSGKASTNVKFFKTATAARAFQDNADLVNGGDKVRIIYDKTLDQNKLGRFAYTFDSATVVNAYGIGVMNANTQTSGRAPCKWTFYGSNDYDGDSANFSTATWVKLDEKSGETACAQGEYRYYEFENADAYTSYMIAFESMDGVGDNYIQFAYLEFFNNDLVPITSGSLERRPNGAWFAEATTEGAADVALELTSEGKTTVTVPVGEIPAAALTDIDKTAYYKATLKAISPSGQIMSYALHGLFYFDDYSSVKKSDYAKNATITVSSDISDRKMQNLVVPVRLSAANIEGFDYADFQRSDYSDLVFFDEYDNVIPHEVENWNPEGESLVWVKFPVVTGGAKITCCYGGPSAGDYAAHTWEGYTGVWHLNTLTGEGNVTYANSSLLGSAADGTKSAASSAGAVGKFGSSCYICSAGVKSGEFEKGGVTIPYSAALGASGSFTISGWFKHKNQSYYYDHMFATRGASGSDGFTVEMLNGWTTAGQIQIKGGSTVSPKIAMTDTMITDWGYCTFVFDGNNYSFYQNGTLEWMKTATGPIKDNQSNLTFGNVSLTDVDANGGCCWCGWIDEVRLMGGVVQTAEEIAWDYGVMTNPNLLLYGMATDASSDLALMIASNVEGLGTPNPAYGTHMSDEGIVTVSAGNPAAADGVGYVATKYTIETSTDDGITWTDPVEHDGNSFDYTYDGKFTRVTWIWEPVAVAVEVASSHASGQLTFSSDPIAVIDDVSYYAFGTKITAIDPGAVSFCKWQDAGACVTVNGNVATLVKGTERVKMTAVSRHKWIFKDNLLTDGNWQIRATVKNTTELTLGTEVVANSACGILDFTAGITSEDGAIDYTLVGFASVTVDKKQVAAFTGSTVLREVYFAPGIQQLGWGTFRDCVNLTTVSPLLPETLSNSNNGQSYSGCTSLTGDVVFLSQNVKSFNNMMFDHTKITSFTAPYLTDLSGGQAFDYCACLTNVTIPAIVKLGTRTFRSCTALEKVTMGETLEVLGNEAFNGCTALTTVTPLLPDSLTTFSTTVYNGTKNSLAFNGCTSLTGDVKLVNAEARDIFGQVFQNTAITSLYAPYATNIWKYALNNCPAITNITFGAEAVTDTSYYPIFGNPKSLEIYFPGKAPVLNYASGERSFGNQNYIRVYCDPQVDSEGWAALMASESFAEPTADELARADYPGVKTLGILRDKNNTRVWLVKYKSPLRKPGLMLLVR